MLKKIMLLSILLIVVTGNSFASTNYKVELKYCSTDIIIPVPNGITVFWNDGNWYKSIGVGYNFYFSSYTNFEVSIKKKIGKIGKFGIYNSLNPLKYPEDSIFEVTEDNSNGYCFNMFELSILEQTLSLFNYFYAEGSINPGINFEVFGNSDANFYFRVPIKIGVKLGTFEVGTSFDIFATPDYDENWTLTNAQIYIGYNLFIK